MNPTGYQYPWHRIQYLRDLHRAALINAVCYRGWGEQHALWLAQAAAYRVRLAHVRKAHRDALALAAGPHPATPTVRRLGVRVTLTPR